MWCAIFTQLIKPKYSEIYAVANPVRDLLDRKRSEEYLPSPNEKNENMAKNL